MANSDKVVTLTSCRICQKTDLIEFLDLGETALANSFLSKGDLDKQEDKFPLRVLFCQNCKLSQLGEVVSPKVMFKDYLYFSSGMPVLPQHFKDYAGYVVGEFIENKDDLVVEIGSNDGMLLLAIKEKGVRILGVDPALNIAEIANNRGVETIADFFSENIASTIVNLYGNAKVIIGNNVVAHINDHHDLVKGIQKLLKKDGAFVFEAPYLIDMFENLAFDTIYHEHLSYLSITPLVELFKVYGMEIFDVKIYPVQGNSIRVFVGNIGEYTVLPSVAECLDKEKLLGLDNIKSYHSLAFKILQLKEKIRSTLLGLKKIKKRIAGYGAPAKGNTLLAYFGIGSDILEYATEGLPSKINLYTPGTHIPVVDIEVARKDPPDYYLMLAWNYKDAILLKEQQFLNGGGKFIMPIGEGEIIG